MIRYKNSLGTTTDYYVVTNWYGDVIQIYNTAGVAVVNYTYGAWGELISIKDQNNNDITSENHIGVIDSIYDEDIILKSITTNGKYDGYITKRLEDIFMIEVDSEYLKKINKIMDAKYDDIDPKDNAVESIIEYAYNNNKIVSIELFESELNDVVGYVKRIKDGQFLVNQISECGADDGVCVVRMDDISFLSCGGEDEIILNKLNVLNLD